MRVFIIERALFREESSLYLCTSVWKMCVCVGGEFHFFCAREIFRDASKSVADLFPSFCYLLLMLHFLRDAQNQRLVVARAGFINERSLA